MISDYILEQVSDVVEQSELDVLIAIGESYCKYLNIICNADNISVIQESFIVMEDGEGNVFTKIKDIFLKVAAYIKSAFQKIFSFIKKKFVTYTASLYGTANLCLLADAIIKENPDSVVTEYDVYTEALTPEEQERKEALERFEAKKAAVKQEVKNNKKSEKEVFTGIKKYYANDVNRKILSNDNIREIVKALRQKTSKQEFIKLQHELRRISHSEKSSMSKCVERNMALVQDLYNSMTESDRAMQDFMENIEIQWRSDIKGEKDMEMRLELIKKFSETLGGTIDKINGTHKFTYENIKNDLYGAGSSEADLFFNLVHSLKSIIQTTPKVVLKTKNNVEKVNEIGAMLYKAHKEFDDAVFEDELKRKQLGLKSNMTIKSILTALDQIKEETYGYTDDKLFNKKAYDSNSVLASYLGGPFSMVLKGIATAISGPIGLSVGVGDLISYILSRTTAKSLNTNSTKIVSDKEAYEHTDESNPLKKAVKKHITGTHMQRAIKDLPLEEQQKIIKKSREDLQRQYDEEKKKNIKNKRK